MPVTSIDAARRFARQSYRYGSTRAVPATAEPIGPSLFQPGSVTPGAALVKLAHSIIAGTARRRAREAQQQASGMALEEASLLIAKLRRDAEGGQYSYTTPSGQTVSGLTGPQRIEAENKFQPPPEKTAPLAKTIKLTQPMGRYAAGAELTPEELSAETARLNREATNTRAATRQVATHDLSAAQAGLRNLDVEGERLSSGALSEFEASLQRNVAALQGKDKDAKEAAKKALGLPTKWAGFKYPEDLSVFESQKKELRDAFLKRIKSRWQKETSDKRRKYQQVIDRNANLLLNLPQEGEAPPEVDPRTQAILQGLSQFGPDAAAP